MPTPPKPYIVLANEKKSHRTKKELSQRKQGEEALTTGVVMKARPEVKSNPEANKEFKRINDLLKKIDKNDAIYEPVLNRYCMLQAECKDLIEKRNTFYEITLKLREKFDDTIDNTPEDEQARLIRQFGRDMASFTASMLECDKQIQTKRKMLLDIEKENVMTIASALRSIPKKTESKTNALLKALGGD